MQSTATAVHKSHACALHGNISERLRRQTVDSAASLSSVFETVRNDALESTACRRSGSQIARLA
eukprot:11189491-Lingulodinium_polyedra.AAC.1